MAWATTAMGGGIWGHGGVASDGTNMFVVTGNTFNTGGNWMGGEAIIRLQSGPVWTGQPTDYWAPTNWLSLDNSDTDLGGVSATVIDVPGATPSQLVLALGKDRNAYLVNRNNLGGITSPVAQANVSGTTLRGTSAVTYRTSLGTYFAFHDDGNAITAYKITATNPPAIVSAWSIGQSGRGSPWVTTTDGTNNTIVWVAGVAGDQRLHGYNADTGAVVYAGGGSNELMTGTRQWNTGIVARGRIYFAADNKIYAFKLPTATPTPTATATHIDCDGNCNSHLNSDTYSRSKPDTDSYGYGNSHTGPNHVDCAGLPSKRATESGLLVERCDFESGRHLPQRRVDRHHKERRFLHRLNRWPSAMASLRIKCAMRVLRPVLIKRR